MRTLGRILTLVVALSVVMTGQTTVGRLGQHLPKATAASSGGLGLIQSTNVEYVGSFALPTGTTGSTSGLSFGGAAIAYNPVSAISGNETLFISTTDVGDGNRGRVAEVSIPAHNTWAVGNSPTGGSTNLTDVQAVRATLVQNFTDITGGRFTTDPIFGTGNHLGGLLVDNGILYGSTYYFYGDTGAPAGAAVSHFRHSINLGSEVQTFAWESVRDPSLAALETPEFAYRTGAGRMTDIPSSLQSSLGGTALTGMHNQNIVTLTSQGYAAFAFTPAAIGSDIPSTSGNTASSAPVLSFGLVYYPNSHPNIGPWGGTEVGVAPRGGSTSIFTWWSWTDVVAGMFLEDGSLVFESAYGKGHTLNGSVDTITNWYGCTSLKTGSGQCDGALVDFAHNGTVIGGGDLDYYAYDPSNPQVRGRFGFPYSQRMVAYKVTDLQAVKAGSKNPWDLVPYAQWDFPLPFDYWINPSTGYSTLGQDSFGSRTTYDRVHRLLYVMQLASLDFPGSAFPMMHVYHVIPASWWWLLCVPGRRRRTQAAA